MTGGSGVRGWGCTLGGLVLASSVLTACGPYQYYGGTGLHDATPTEVTGVWENIEGTRVVFRDDGTALLEKLDGQDFDFDDGWRLSGAGTWKLTDAHGGQRVRLALTDRTGVDRRVPPPADEDLAPEAPSTYTWRFFVDRDRHDEVVLFFFYGDPDSGNSYVMRHSTAAQGEFTGTRRAPRYGSPA